MFSTHTSPHPFTYNERTNQQDSSFFFKLPTIPNFFQTCPHNLHKSTTIPHQNHKTQSRMMQLDTDQTLNSIFGISLQSKQSMQNCNKQKLNSNKQQQIGKLKNMIQQLDKQKLESDKTQQKPPLYFPQYQEFVHGQVQQQQEYTIIQDEFGTIHQLSTDECSLFHQKTIHQEEKSMRPVKKIKQYNQNGCQGDSFVDFGIIQGQFQIDFNKNTSQSYTYGKQQPLSDFQLSNFQNLQNKSKQQRQTEQLWSIGKQRDLQLPIEHVCYCDDIKCFYNRYQRPRPIYQMKTLHSRSPGQKYDVVERKSGFKGSEFKQVDKDIQEEEQQWLSKEINKLHIFDYTTQIRIPPQIKKKQISKRWQEREDRKNSRRFRAQPKTQIFWDMKGEDIDSDSEQLQRILEQIRSD